MSAISSISSGTAMLSSSGTSLTAMSSSTASTSAAATTDTATINTDGMADGVNRTDSSSMLNYADTMLTSGDAAISSPDLMGMLMAALMLQAMVEGQDDDKKQDNSLAGLLLLGMLNAGSGQSLTMTTESYSSMSVESVYGGGVSSGGTGDGMNAMQGGATGGMVDAVA